MVTRTREAREVRPKVTAAGTNTAAKNCTPTTEVAQSALSHARPPTNSEGDRDTVESPVRVPMDVTMIM